MDRMEVIQPAHAAQRPPLAPLLGATVVATFSIVFGIVIAYVAIATPVLRREASIARTRMRSA